MGFRARAMVQDLGLGFGFPSSEGSKTPLCLTMLFIIRRRITVACSASV